MQRFLEENKTIILFGQGLVFFSLGFAVWLQRRRATRLRLTQSLIWLAAFAFVEALAVWGYVFVPIQEGYIRSGPVQVLVVLRALLQTSAFLFLFQFGMHLIARGRRTLFVWSLVSTLGWLALLLVTAVAAQRAGWSVGQWERSVEALSRHAILLPATLLAALGLWRQRAELADVGLGGIKGYAGAMAGGLLAYALLAGIVVDHAFWKPGLATPDAERFAAFGIQLSLARAAVGLVLAVLAVKLLEIFEVEAKQQLEAVERARAVAEERARFGRDLHDGTIQSLYAAGLHLESVAIVSQDDDTKAQVRSVVEGLNETIGGIRTYISGLRSDQDDAVMIAVELQEQARQFGENAGVEVSFTAQGMARAGILPDETHQHLEQVLREALSNAARHGRAEHIDVELKFLPDELDLIVSDDGIGIPAEPTHSGEGLRNMRERARRLGGRAVIERGAVRGTRVAIAIPLDFDSHEESESEPQGVLR